MLSKITEDQDEANQETQIIAAPMLPSYFRILLFVRAVCTAQMAAKSLSFPLEIEKALIRRSRSVPQAARRRGIAHPVS